MCGRERQQRAMLRRGVEPARRDQYLLSQSPARKALTDGGGTGRATCVSGCGGGKEDTVRCCAHVRPYALRGPLGAHCREHNHVRHRARDDRTDIHLSTKCAGHCAVALQGWAVAAARERDAHRALRLRGRCRCAHNEAEHWGRGSFALRACRPVIVVAAVVVVVRCCWCSAWWGCHTLRGCGRRFVVVARSDAMALGVAWKALSGRRVHSRIGFEFRQTLKWHQCTSLTL